MKPNGPMYIWYGPIESARQNEASRGRNSPVAAMQERHRDPPRKDNARLPEPTTRTTAWRPRHHRHFCSRPGWVAGSRAPGRRDAQRQASSFGARPAAGEGGRGCELAAVAGWREEAPRIGDAQSLPRQPLAESKNLTAGSTAGSGWAARRGTSASTPRTSTRSPGDQRLRPDADGQADAHPRPTGRVRLDRRHLPGDLRIPAIQDLVDHYEVTSHHSLTLTAVSSPFPCFHGKHWASSSLTNQSMYCISSRLISGLMMTETGGGAVRVHASAHWVRPWARHPQAALRWGDKYNMRTQKHNFSMGQPRVKFSSSRFPKQNRFIMIIVILDLFLYMFDYLFYLKYLYKSVYFIIIYFITKEIWNITYNCAYMNYYFE
jgi:hypothetical protein